MQKHEKIYVAGHTGLVGSALVRKLRAAGYTNIVTANHTDVELDSQAQVAKFFKALKPDYVFLAAGKTGGVYANDTYRADFIYENLAIQGNVIHQSFLSEVKKLVYFGCSSMYPKLAPQPMKEEHLLSAPLEPTNEPFAIAKIAGWKMCESYTRQYGSDFITIIPTNLYGANQNYTPLNSLVVPSLITKFHEAKANRAPEVVLWGSGRPSRDFLFVDDLADASIFLMNSYSDSAPINVGSGRDFTVRELADVVCRVIGYQGDIVWDQSKPDGVLQKLQDISKISGMGWKPKVALEEGIKISYQDFLETSRV